jgi:hypothetical protein
MNGSVGQYLDTILFSWNSRRVEVVGLFTSVSLFSYDRETHSRWFPNEFFSSGSDGLVPFVTMHIY